MEAKSPQENIQIMTNDVISVPIAQLVYVVGSVQHAGGFPVWSKNPSNVQHHVRSRNYWAATL
jgi:hypothetical protein